MFKINDRVLVEGLGYGFVTSVTADSSYMTVNIDGLGNCETDAKNVAVIA